MDFFAVLSRMISNEDALSLRATCLVILSFLSGNPSLRRRIAEQRWSCQWYNGSSVCRPETFQQSVFANIRGDNSLIPVCNHFCKQTPVPSGVFYRSIADMDRQRMMERYMQSNICQSDILLDEVALDEEEETVLSLVLSLSSMVNGLVARQRLMEIKSLHPAVFHKTRRGWDGV